MKVNKTWSKLLVTERYKKKYEDMLTEKKENSEKLHIASGHGNAVEVESIISNLVVDVNYKWGWDLPTPLMEATKAGHNRVVKILLDKGANIDKAAYWSRWTPLHYAAYYDRIYVVNLLLDEGAEVDEADDMGCSPLFRAAQSGCKDVVKVLLERGAEPNK